jgi:hypothetical protein
MACSILNSFDFVVTHLSDTTNDVTSGKCSVSFRKYIVNTTLQDI